MKRRWYLVLAVPVLFIFYACYLYIRVSGVLGTPDPILADSCVKIPLAIGSEISLGTEDIVIDRDTGLVMISSMNRFDRYVKNQIPADGIYGFHLEKDGSTSAKQLILLSHDAPAEFHPHGIHFWKGITDEGLVQKRLFVVNHRSDIDKAVEVFRVSEDLKLHHLKTITSPEIYSPNDLAAVGPNSFYLSNDHGRGKGLIKSLEELLFLPRSNVIFYDGNKAKVVARRQVFANGMAVSSDNKTIYLANPPAHKISVFKRMEDNNLRKTKTFKLSSAPDNIDIASDGSLWTGAHARLFDYISYRGKKRETAPSHVVRIDPATGESKTILYTDRGELSASSTAATYAGRLLVGSVYEGAVLNCPIRD